MPAESKGQSQIIQFMMFFMIGLVLFLAISGVFRGRLDFFAEDIADQNRRLISGYFSALAVNELVTCKQCDNVNITTVLVNTTAGSFSQVRLNNSFLAAFSPPTPGESALTVHNLLAEVSTKLGSAVSNRPIILTYSRGQSILEVRS